MSVRGIWAQAAFLKLGTNHLKAPSLNSEFVLVCVDEKYCIHCKYSRYFEVHDSDGQKRQTGVAQKILQYLPFILRIQ
jgi:hypothetical protein